MIESLLIANRGEIARRIIRTARRLGVRTVAVYSDADADAPHVREADAAVPIGPAPARESYLVSEKIIAAAKASGAAAIHPGYGFLSENAAFAEAVTEAGLVWVGPPPAAIRAMGLKDAAKALMIRAGVPVTPGYLGEDQSETRLAREAEAIGYPVLIKAVAGGGGKGMRKVEAAAGFADALAGARREGAASFGDDRVLLERYVERPRHIEVQVFGDTHGNVVHLFERDCSLQRRHQKVIEEAPAPGMDQATRAAICGAAVRAAQAVGYVGAGTVEFIADASGPLSADRIWFMEMNTRLQVEHPVTEAVTGLDLVEWQLRIASGEPLPLTQDQIRLDGWAMEARLYAEDPAKGFLPSTGPLTYFRLPPDLRIDSGVEEGGAVGPDYDPMLAKLIAHGETREAARAKLRAGCAQVAVWPVHTNAGFLVRCLDLPAFASGAVTTDLIGAELAALSAPAPPSDDLLAAAAGRWVEAAAKPGVDPWTPRRGGGLLGFRLNATAQAVAHLAVNATTLATPVGEPGGQTILPIRAGLVAFEDGWAYEIADPEHAAHAGEAASDVVRAPMPGRVTNLAVAVGQRVAKGQPLLTLEAMKMEHTLTAPFDGAVAEVSAAAGAQVSEGAMLVRLEPQPA